MIQVTITGNLVEDAVIKKKRSGEDYVYLKVAAHEKFGGEQTTTYFIVSFDRCSVRPILLKGRRVLVSGRMSFASMLYDEKIIVSHYIYATIVELQDPRPESGIKDFNI